MIMKTWLDYINAQGNWISDDLARLSPNQRNILAALAFQPITEPQGNDFSERVKIAASSIKKSLGVLIKQDFVYKDKEGQYKVLDPAIETYLQHIKYFDFIDES